MKYVLVGIVFLCSTLGFAQTKIKPIRSFYTNVQEPSDIALHPTKDTYFVVSDNGFLHEVDSLGQIIRTADFEGYDTEGVWAQGEFVYVVEEMVRKIRVFNIDDLSLVRTVNVPYQGGRNKAYEAITYNPARNSFIIITEKDPVYLFELDDNLIVQNEIELKKIARDISAATFHNGFLWLLSDEDREVIQLNPENYSVIQRWVVPIINPEGLVFNRNNELIIVSDDREKFYVFDAKTFTK